VVVAKHVVEAMVAEEAAAVTGLNGSSGGGLGTVHGDTSKAPNTMSDLKAAGKRPTAIMGLGGSSPPPPARAFAAPGGMLHIFFVDSSFCLIILCVGLLTLASALQGNKPEYDAIIPEIQSPWLYRGWCPPPGFGNRCGPRQWHPSSRV
jgi:hypothetical protein